MAKQASLYVFITLWNDLCRTIRGDINRCTDYLMSSEISSTKAKGPTPSDPGDYYVSLGDAPSYFRIARWVKDSGNLQTMGSCAMMYVVCAVIILL